MRFTEILDTLQGLDRAYDEIAAEYTAARGGLSAPSWWSIVRERPRRAPGQEQGALLCAKHGGAPHGLPHDGLSDHLATEVREWVHVARWSPAARSLLGIERIDPAPAARVGALVYLDEAREHRVRFAASDSTILPSDAGRWMWAKDRPERVAFRPRSQEDTPYLFFSNTDGKGRRWSFTDVKKGYEEYLAAAGRRADEAALSRLWSSPTPMLLGTLTDYNRRNVTERAPLALSEAFLEDGGPEEVAGELAEPCEACQFALSAWMCGHQDMLARMKEGAAAEYAAEAAEWVERLRGRKEPPKKPRSLRGADLDSGPRSGAVAPPADSPSPAPEAPATPGAATPPAPALGVPYGPSTGIGAGRRTGAWNLPAKGEMIDLPERDVTGRDRDRRTGNVAWNERPSVDPFSRREPVRLRLDSSEFDVSNVEIRELTGREALSKLFSFHLLIVCFDVDGLDTKALLGASVSIVFEQGREEVRRVYGMIAEVDDHLETESEWRSYRLWIVPRAWRSTLVETQEVYLDVNVPDLVKQKLALVGLAGDDVEMRLTGTYPARELIVQYKETDVAFVSRLCEHLGITFFFEHDGGSDKIVFSDANTGFRPLAGGALPFRARGDRADIFELTSRSRAFPASYAMQDYNYRTPQVDLTAMVEEAEGFGGGVVEYGAHHKTPAEGGVLAKIRGEERVSSNQYLLGRSDRAELSPGGTFTLRGHARLDGADYLVTEVEHHAVQTVKMQGGGASEEPYRNTFRLVPSARAYRPPRATPRPRIPGVLTAVVEPDPSGEIGESAQIDADGRYTVKFYFDAGDVAGRPKNSRPVRMVQPHAGPSYGIHFPLKPGIEVLLVFVDGDPDRPMIIGSVPNPVTPSPVVQEVNLMNRIETASGLIIEMRDAVPPLAR